MILLCLLSATLLRLFSESLLRPLSVILLRHLAETETLLLDLSLLRDLSLLLDLSPRWHPSLPQTVQPELAPHTNRPTCQHFPLLPRTILHQQYRNNYIVAPPSGCCSFWFFLQILFCRFCFLTVSNLVRLLQKATIEITFENVCLLAVGSKGWGRIGEGS